MKQEKLDSLRTEINEIESELLILLAKRRRLSYSVLEFKVQTNKPIRDESRETALLEKLLTYGHSLGLDSHYISRVFQTIIEDSVLHQQAMLQHGLNPGTLGDQHKVARS